MKLLQHYLSSFKEIRKIGYLFLVDLVFASALIIMFSLFNTIIQSKIKVMGINGTPEQIKEMLATAAPEVVQQFAAQMKSFVFSFIGGGILFLVLIFLLFSLSQAMIWNYLLKKKLTVKNYWRWNLINLVLIIPLILYLLLMVPVKLIFNSLLVQINNQFLSQLLNVVISLSFILLAVLVVFLTYYCFMQQKSAWTALGESFNLIRKRWSNLLKLFGISLATAIVLNLLFSFLLQRWLYALSAWFITFYNTILILLFLAWLRVFLMKIIHE